LLSLQFGYSVLQKGVTSKGIHCQVCPCHFKSSDQVTMPKHILFQKQMLLHINQICEHILISQNLYYYLRRVVSDDNCWRIFQVAFHVLQGLACFRGSEHVTYCSLWTKVWITNMLLNWKCRAYWILDIACCNCIDNRLQNQLSFSRCLSLFWNTLKLKYSGSFWERTCNLSSYCCEVTCHVKNQTSCKS